jgi:uncharacterized protein YkwD
MGGMKFIVGLVLAALFSAQDMPNQEPPKKEEPPKQEPPQDPKKEEPKKQDPKPEPKKENPLIVKLNEIRKSYGVPALEEDPALSDACKKHADYLSRNNADGEKEDPHDENRKKAAFSAEGKKAAAHSLISFGEASFEKTIDNWMGTYLMRCQLLDPGLKKTGFGQVGRVCVMDVQSSRIDAGFEPIVCPFDKQDKVGIRFGYGGDDPDPLPKTVKYGDCGFPVTVLFPTTAKVKGVAWTFKDAAGKRVDCWTSTPEGRLIKYDRVVDHSIALIPKTRLSENSTYTVWVKCVIDGKAFEKTWTFTTQ